MSCFVKVTSSVSNFIVDHVYSKRVYEKILRSIQLLADYPDMGRVYQPSYPAAQTSFPCRYFAVPDTPFTLYYLIDEASDREGTADCKNSQEMPNSRDDQKGDGVLTVFYIENQSMDPTDRFIYAGVDW